MTALILAMKGLNPKIYLPQNNSCKNDKYYLKQMKNIVYHISQYQEQLQAPHPFSLHPFAHLYMFQLAQPAQIAQV